MKALTLANAVICGGILAGCTKPRAKRWKSAAKSTSNIAVLGSLAAMRAGSAARYGHEKNPTLKVAAEGIEALKEVVGLVDRVLGQLVGGIQSGMGYLCAANLEQLRTKARFIRVSSAG